MTGRMNDLYFKSSFSMDEIEDNYKDFDLYSSLMDGLKEIVAQKESKGASSEIPDKEMLEISKRLIDKNREAYRELAK